MTQSTRRDSAAELHKLAHQLGVPPGRLGFLAGVGGDELRTLRGQIGDALFRAGRPHFVKVVAVSRIVPIPLAARLTEHTLPPLIAARTAELLDAPRAIEMVDRLSDGYLADVSAALDPTRAPDLLAQIPPARVAAVGAELARRGEWVVMGGFVSVVSAEALRAAVSILDGEQLLHVGFVLDDLARLEEITAALRDDQLGQMLRAAAGHRLWRELDEVLVNLDRSGMARFAARYAQADADTVAAIRAAAADGSLSGAALARLDIS